MPTVEERNALVLRWLRLPRYVRFRLRRSPRLRPLLDRLPVDESLSIGTLALVTAASRWEPERGSFPSLAFKVIARDICRAAAEYGPVRVPESTQRLNGGLRPPAVVPLPVRLPGREPDPAEAAARSELPGSVVAALAGLSPRRREVLRLRVLEGRTLQEVADRLSVSRQRVLQLEAAVLHELSAAVGAC